jgi:GGDEF domain-containing protein
MESIAILMVEKGRARVVRFRVELAGEADWSLASHTVAEALKQARPDMITVVESEGRARQLAEELRRNGRADAVILLSPETAPEAQDHLQVALPAPFDPAKPKQLMMNLAQALVQAQNQEPRNPLSGLPGVGLLREEVGKRLREGIVFGFLYVDLDNFKAYNDYYGFARGDEAIKLLADTLKKAVAECGASEDLAIHIGGDDFGVLATPARAAKIAEAVIAAFDAQVPNLYDKEDRERGFILTRDRRGNEARFPIMTLSVAGVSNVQRSIEGYLELSEIAAEMKTFAKQTSGSIYVQDRRRDEPPHKK